MPLHPAKVQWGITCETHLRCLQEGLLRRGCLDARKELLLPVKGQGAGDRSAPTLCMANCVLLPPVPHV